MVKKSQTPEFKVVHFFPLEDKDVAPPEIIERGDADSDYRIAQIISYQNYLISEIERRSYTVNVYKYIEWVVFIIEMIIATLDISLGIYGLVTDDHLSVTTKISIVVTTIGTIVRTYIKTFMKKVEKHRELLTLARGKNIIVKDKYNLFIKDGEISDQEYKNLVADFKKYEEAREEVIKRYKTIKDIITSDIMPV